MEKGTKHKEQRRMSETPKKSDYNATHIANAYATGLAVCLVVFLKSFSPSYWAVASVLACLLYAFAAIKQRKDTGFFGMVLLSSLWFVISYMLFSQFKPM